MSNVSLCRVCLASNIKMHHIANTRYEEIFNKLATQLRTEDKRPETLCFVCYFHLQRCIRFMIMSRKAEEILTQFSSSGIQLTEETVSILDRKFVHKLSWTPLQYLCVNDEILTSQIKVDIKEECEEVFNQINEAETEVEPIILATIKKEITDSNELSTEWPKDMVIVKKEITDNDVLATKEEQVEFERPNMMAVIKKEIIDYEELANREKVKEEKIKEEHEGDLDAVFEVKVPEETSYEEVHITNPEQSNKYPCEHCEKTYTHKFHLNRHKKTHAIGPNNTLVRDYTCELCGKAYIQKCSLTKHLLNHTGHKPFACDFCPTRCLQKIDMIRHMRVHTGQKPFKCDICKQRFSRKSNMKLHILTHADSKPFECHICNKSFSRKYDLNRHNKRKHTGERPYSCDKCDFRSVNGSYLKTHIENKHVKPQGEKPYACDKCNFKCANAGYLKIHEAKKHLSGKSKTKKAKIKTNF